MSHAPPVPEASVAPWPAHPAPQGAETPGPEKADDGPAPAASSSTLKKIGVGAAIGSAAIAAALLYVNHGRRK